VPPLATEPVCLALTTTGDVEIPLRFVSGVEAAAQGCRERLRAVRGEWFRDLNLGVPWFENDQVPPTRAILGQRYDERRVRAEVRAALLGDPTGVITEILRLDVSFSTATRVLTIRWQVRCAFGDTPVETLEI
jgi:hypothetical protein